MKTLTIASLQRPLTVLEVAEENLRSTKAKLLTVLAPYDNERREIERQIHELHMEIDAIEEAANEDPTIAALFDERDEWQELSAQVLDAVKTLALSAWQLGETSGVKQWRQGKWEVGLQSTLESSKTIGLRGLEVYDRASVSVTKVEED